MAELREERVVLGEVVVNAPLSQVWDAWTTNQGAETFFAPKCQIDPRPGGTYIMYFDLEAAPGDQGAEGMIVMALQPERMLSFTWNAPPHLPSVRGQMTHVTVRLEQVAGSITRVVLRHDGWGDGGEWDQAYEYFERAWKKVVLPRLQYRFEVGPVDWQHPPDFGVGEAAG
jgi:uncharacterized protein YndB with AHSA1/START domain